MYFASSAGRYVRQMSRELRVAPEVAEILPASHLAQLASDVDSEDNVCVRCGTLIEDASAELVVLQDEQAVLARLAHEGCARSGVYEWEGTSAAVAALTLRPDGVDVATALVWRTVGAPRAIVLIEPRIHISLDDGQADPLERLFAAPLGLHPAGGTLADLAPPAAPGSRLELTRDGLRLDSEALRITVPANAATVARWHEHADGERAIVILGRGLGITRPDDELVPSLQEALRLRPCWAGVVEVAP